MRTIASGNIGLPFATAVRQSNQLDVMVLEVSSFQLETIHRFRPQVAVWLNLSPNHLDRYRDVGRIPHRQAAHFRQPDARGFCRGECEGGPALLSKRAPSPSAPTPKTRISPCARAIIYYRGEPVLDQSTTKLPGIHNAENLMAALGIGLAIGLDFERMAGAVTEYTAPVHRCEFVRELDGVRWINDSKATNLDSVEKAILSQKGPLLLIAGGKDKGFEFDPIAPLVRERVREAVLIGEMKERIARSWDGVSSRLAATLEEAVQIARDLAEPGDTVLFSPGTSSFDMFRNYGERGNCFKDAVKSLTTKQG